MEGNIIFGLIFAVCLLYLICFYQKTAFVDNALDIHKRIKLRVIYHLGIMLFLLGALRNKHTGTDTIHYCLRYEKIWYDGYDTIVDIWRDAFSSPLSERGYYLTARYFSYIFPSAQVWLAFLCLLFIVPCSILVYKYSQVPPLSFMYLLAMPIYIFVWQGLRQCMAMAICLFALLFATQKKWWQFGLLLFLAFQCHRSSILFLLVIPTIYVDADKKLFWGILGAIIIIVFNPISINRFLLAYLGDIDKIQDYALNSNLHVVYKMFLLLLLLFSLSYTVKDELIKQNKINKLFLIFSAYGVILQLFSIVILEFFRASFYFSIFNMLLVPNACHELEKKFPGFPVGICVWLLLVISCYLMGIFDYWFCWEDRPWFT